MPGTERSRQDIYGPTPSRHDSRREEAVELPTDADPPPREPDEDEAAIEAITTFIRAGAPEVSEAAVRRAAAKSLLSRVVSSGEFALGDNDETRRLGALNKRVTAFRRRQEAGVAQLPARRYHRA